MNTSCGLHRLAGGNAGVGVVKGMRLTRIDGGIESEFFPGGPVGLGAGGQDRADAQATGGRESATRARGHAEQAGLRS